jgi:hypothetical protein
MHTIFGRFRPASLAAAVLLCGSAGVQAQNFPITPAQQSTAAQG